MKIKDLVTKIARLEGKKHQATIGDVREIVGIISDIFWKETLNSKIPNRHMTGPQLHFNGWKRAQKAPKKVRKARKTVKKRK